jgi:hypothetical protein
VRAVEWRRWQREEEAGVAATGEETSGVESGGDLDSFRMKNETTQDGLLFICSKISATVLN